MTEFDPNGKSAKDSGSKLDAGKNRVGLVLGGFADALWEVGRVGTFGANKYTDNGWMTVENGEARYDDAMFRHWLKMRQGEVIDDESGMYHAAQVAWNALAHLSLMLRRVKKEQDDQQPSNETKERTTAGDTVEQRGVPDVQANVRPPLVFI